MKTKNAAVLVVVSLGLAASLFAADKLSANAEPKVIWLKSHGEPVAELRILRGGDQVEVTADQSSYNSESRLMVCSGATSVKIKVAGGSPIIIKADEVEMSSFVK